MICKGQKLKKLRFTRCKACWEDGINLFLKDKSKCRKSYCFAGHNLFTVDAEEAGHSVHEMSRAYSKSAASMASDSESPSKRCTCRPPRPYSIINVLKRGKCKTCGGKIPKN